MLTRLNNRRRTRGAAFTEALIMLPVFLLTWWGYQLLFQAHSAHGKAMEQARQSAWEQSLDGCGIMDDRNTETCAGDCGSAPGASSVWGEITGGDLGFLGGILSGLFGPTVGDSISVDFDSDEINIGRAGDGLTRTGAATAGMTVVCNTKRQTLWMLIKQAVCNIPGVSVIGDIAGLCPP